MRDVNLQAGTMSFIGKATSSPPRRCPDGNHDATPVQM
jgi:hypothetical protein